jgi:hypothetical protein
MGNKCCGSDSGIGENIYSYLLTSRIRDIKYSEAKLIIDKTFLPYGLQATVTADELLGINTIVSNQLQKILSDFYLAPSDCVDDDCCKQEQYIKLLVQEFSANKYLYLFLFYSLYSNKEDKLRTFLPMLLLYTHNENLNYVELYDCVKEYLNINLCLSYRINKYIFNKADVDGENHKDTYTAVNLENFLRKIFKPFENDYLYYAENYFKMPITQKHMFEIFGKYSPDFFDFFKLQQLFMESLDE